MVQGLGYVATAPEDGLLGWGDEHVCHAVLDRDGTRSLVDGALCVTRRGKMVSTFEIRGIPLAEPGAMDRLLVPQLAALETYALGACP